MSMGHSSNQGNLKERRRVKEDCNVMTVLLLTIWSKDIFTENFNQKVILIIEVSKLALKGVSRCANSF